MKYWYMETLENIILSEKIQTQKKIDLIYTMCQNRQVNRERKLISGCAGLKSITVLGFISTVEPTATEPTLWKSLLLSIKNTS